MNAVSFGPSRRFSKHLQWCGRSAFVLLVQASLSQAASCGSHQPSPVPVTVVVSEGENLSPSGPTHMEQSSAQGDGSTTGSVAGGSSAAGSSSGGSSGGSVAGSDDGLDESGSALGSVPHRTNVCGPFKPIKSGDLCKTASDCAPSSMCHARSCVAVAKAPVRDPRAMCTMQMVCPSTDNGRCDCVDGECALVSR